MLVNQQSMLEADRQTAFSESAVRILNPQGLAVGNISFSWRPETDRLIVHKVHILRDGKAVDVLAGGQQFTVVRRETNLEKATLDGVLTANLQPEGLQVGDVLNIAVSIVSSDPVMKGHVEQFAGGWNGVAIDRAFLRVSWPESVKMQIRQSADLPPIKKTKSSKIQSAELTLENVPTIVTPKAAPLRFMRTRVIEFTDFAQWSGIARLMTPLYAQASRLPEGPLQAEVARIRALSPDPKRRAEAALQLVQDRIRYVALAMGAGGYVPADIATTWSRRYGDCKAKTALLLGLLQAIDIPAEAVLVHTMIGDGMDERLPTVGSFNHIIVRATIAGQTYWMDGTRTGDTNLDRLITPAWSWGLPVRETGSALVRMMPGPLSVPTQDTEIRIDASRGIYAPAPTRIETVFRGEPAVATNAAIGMLPADMRDKAMRDYWKGQHDFITPKTASGTFDAAKGEYRLVPEGYAEMDWAEGYETDGTNIGYQADFKRDPGPNQGAPFAVTHPYFERVRQTIILPPDFKPALRNAADISETIAGIEYRRKSMISGNIFTIEKSERSLGPEFPASEAPAAQARLRKLANEDVRLELPAGYRASEHELDAMKAQTPGDAKAYVDRGLVFLDAGRFDEAVADFSAANKLDPKDAWALANRGIAHASNQNVASAERDIAAALAIDATNPVAYRARALVEIQRENTQAAINDLTKSLVHEPGNSWALEMRASLYFSEGKRDLALADTDALIAKYPENSETRLMRANAFALRGDAAAAMREADALMKASRTDVMAYVVAAKIYARFDRKQEAMQAFDKAIAVKDDAIIYLNRADVRERDDFAGRQADIDAGLKRDPTNPDGLIAKARLQTDKGDHHGSIATLTAALTTERDNMRLLRARAIAYSKVGNAALADKDFAAMRAKVKTPTDLNNLCWDKATAGVALETALAECNEALTKAPNIAGFLDSRALAYLRLGRLDEALADYDRALALAPRQTASLYGRAVAWHRKGDKAKSNTDLAAARKISPNIDKEFASYGVTIP